MTEQSENKLQTSPCYPFILQHASPKKRTFSYTATISLSHSRNLALIQWNYPIHSLYLDFPNCPKSELAFFLTWILSRIMHYIRLFCLFSILLSKTVPQLLKNLSVTLVFLKNPDPSFCKMSHSTSDCYLMVGFRLSIWEKNTT